MEKEINTLCEPDMQYAGKYSYADYLLWTIEERFELIKGKIFKMSPAPNTVHQRISMKFTATLFNYFNDKSCELFAAPFDVRFPLNSKRNEDIFTVLQPDLCVVCDPSKIDKAGCLGAPDLVVEILSPSNNARELKSKYEVYEESGVKEYWVVSPQNKTFLSYRLNDAGKYLPTRLMVAGDTYFTDLFPGLALDFELIFKNVDV